MGVGRTALTEVGTALGCLGLPSLDWAVLQRPPIDGVDGAAWQAIERELADPTSRSIGQTAFGNGVHLGAHAEGLDGRVPRQVEWTGGRKPPGDEVVPADLRIDHVYLVSCKYLSNIVLNTAPARLFVHLLQPGVRHDASDWFAVTAPDEYAGFLGDSERLLGLEPSNGNGVLTTQRRAALKAGLREAGRALPTELAGSYRHLCDAVSRETASRWRASLPSRGSEVEPLVWRMLRLTSAPYFVLGAAKQKRSLRLRVMTPWDWRQAFELRGLDIEPAGAGQPQVTWAAHVRDRDAGTDRTVVGHVEIRWSHGRFAGPPEAKVYLDTPHAEVPGYVPLV